MARVWDVPVRDRIASNGNQLPLSSPSHPPHASSSTAPAPGPSHPQFPQLTPTNLIAWPRPFGSVPKHSMAPTMKNHLVQNANNPETLLRHSSTNPPSLCSPKSSSFLHEKDREAVFPKRCKIASSALITAYCPWPSRLLWRPRHLSPPYTLEHGAQ